MSLLLAFALSTATSAPVTLSPDLHEVSNLKMFAKNITLNPTQIAALRKNQFFVCPSADENLYTAYGENDYENVPSLLTADNLLQIYHIFFDSTLRTAEQSKMLPDLEAMTAAMQRQSLATLDALKGSPLEAAATKNAAYFTVAAQLLGQKPATNGAVSQLADAEKALISAHEGFETSAIFPYKMDYSQFIPRGHYTKSPELTRYFLAMMWYGLAPISVEIQENGVLRPAPELAQQALLAAHDLEASGALPRWEKLYEITALFAGRANDATPPEWNGAAKQVFGEDVRSYGDPAKLATFLADVHKIHPPLIVSKRTKDANAGPIQIRFMGQRAIPDSYILQELSDPDARPFPSPLDVFSVLGSARATQILDGNASAFNPKGWADYRPIRANLTQQFANLAPSVWRSDLYWNWLNVIRPMANPLPATAPAFMRTNAWMDRCLDAALGSWAELRHDTILYAMQSVAEMGDGDEDQPYTPGYVEPNAELYTRLTAAVQQMHDELKTRGYLSTDAGDLFTDFQSTIAFFKSAAEKELAGKPLSRQEHLRIRKMEGDLESLNTRMQTIGNNYQMLSTDDLFMALVADVHTANGQALEVGVGQADHIVAVIPIEGKLYLARGTGFSYYEFKRPVAQRMTDEQWKAMLRANKSPARPFWTSSYFVASPLKEKNQ